MTCRSMRMWPHDPARSNGAEVAAGDRGRHSILVAIPHENPDSQQTQILDGALPRTRSVLLESGHFVWEDRAEDYAAAILGGYRAA
jgi:hypothetical protein